MVCEIWIYRVWNKGNQKCRVLWCLIYRNYSFTVKTTGLLIVHMLVEFEEKLNKYKSDKKAERNRIFAPLSTVKAANKKRKLSRQWSRVFSGIYRLQREKSNNNQTVGPNAWAPNVLEVWPLSTRLIRIWSHPREIMTVSEQSVLFSLFLKIWVIF